VLKREKGRPSTGRQGQFRRMDTCLAPGFAGPVVMARPNQPAPTWSGTHRVSRGHHAAQTTGRGGPCWPVGSALPERPPFAPRPKIGRMACFFHFEARARFSTRTAARRAGMT
jgi:hypothetical protein